MKMTLPGRTVRPPTGFGQPDYSVIYKDAGTRERIGGLLNGPEIIINANSVGSTSISRRRFPPNP
jgi:hypothetical protein